MRTFRAQGVALEDLQKCKSSELDLLNLADENVMKAGDLAGTLFRSGDKVCLAVLMVKGFRIGKDKAPCTVIEMDKPDNAASNIRIIAQVMELENPRTSASLTSPGEDFWEWTDCCCPVPSSSSTLFFPPSSTVASRSTAPHQCLQPRLRLCRHPPLRYRLFPLQHFAPSHPLLPPCRKSLSSAEHSIRPSRPRSAHCIPPPFPL
ncbi:hypothetical protein B0H10DRAFT_2226523 [Mycena sp. CBHHK59/15]|nr:hypothetical protein B0H10DRAFT_2226523 [Mycena sp. CBHHK59/15]